MKIMIAMMSMIVNQYNENIMKMLFSVTNNRNHNNNCITTNRTKNNININNTDRNNNHHTDAVLNN